MRNSSFYDTQDDVCNEASYAEKRRQYLESFECFPRLNTSTYTYEEFMKASSPDDKDSESDETEDSETELDSCQHISNSNDSEIFAGDKTGLILIRRKVLGHTVQDSDTESTSDPNDEIFIGDGKNEPILVREKVLGQIVRIDDRLENAEGVKTVNNEDLSSINYKTPTPPPDTPYVISLQSSQESDSTTVIGSDSNLCVAVISAEVQGSEAHSDIEEVDELSFLSTYKPRDTMSSTKFVNKLKRTWDCVKKEEEDGIFDIEFHKRLRTFRNLISERSNGIIINIDEPDELDLIRN